MMKWCVYWQPDDIEMAWYPSKAQALVKIQELIAECEELLADSERAINWDITLLHNCGEALDGMGGFRLVLNNEVE